MPVTLVSTSLATVAIDTFMTELSKFIRNWPAARVNRTIVVPCPALPTAAPAFTLPASSRPGPVRAFRPRDHASLRDGPPAGRGRRAPEPRDHQSGTGAPALGRRQLSGPFVGFEASGSDHFG